MAPAVSTVVIAGLTFVVKISLVYSTNGSGICSKDGWDFINKNFLSRLIFAKILKNG